MILLFFYRLECLIKTKLRTIPLASWMSIFRRVILAVAVRLISLADAVDVMHVHAPTRVSVCSNPCDAGTVVRTLNLNGVKHGSIKVSVAYEKLN